MMKVLSGILWFALTAWAFVVTAVVGYSAFNAFTLPTSGPDALGAMTGAAIVGVVCYVSVAIPYLALRCLDECRRRD